MEVRLEVFLLIAGCALVTWVVRVFPIACLKGTQPPRWFVDWLEFIPTAIMSALVGVTIFFPESNVMVWKEVAPFFYASLPTALVAFITRSLGVTVVVGVVAMYLILSLV